MFHLHRTGVADSIHNLLSSHSRAPPAFDLLFPSLRGFENNIVLSIARFLPAMARAWKRDRYLTFSSATVRPVGPPSTPSTPVTHIPSLSRGLLLPHCPFLFSARASIVAPLFLGEPARRNCHLWCAVCCRRHRAGDGFGFANCTN